MFSFQASDNGIHTLHDSEGRHIANVRSVRGTAEKERELLALIAAAPAMLAALQAGLDALGRIDDFSRATGGDHPDIHNRALDAMAAAIALATGAPTGEAAGDGAAFSHPAQDSRDWWAEDAEFPLADWQAEVANNDTRLGYHDWRKAMRTQ